MINPKCHTTEWIDTLSRQFSYPDKNLIEKVVRTMSLLDMLARSGCPFIFKGGSCLMLLLKDSAHRLSIDIDILCPPGTNIEDYLKDYAVNGFLDYQLILLLAFDRRNIDSSSKVTCMSDRIEEISEDLCLF